MMKSPISHKQATTLAAFIATLRPDWQTPGIVAAIGQAREVAPADEVAHAAIRAAVDAKNRTPAVIPLEGVHWRGAEATPQHNRPDDGHRCSVCNQPQARCRQRWTKDHQFLSVAQAKQVATVKADEVRAALAPTRTYTPDGAA